MDFSSNEYELMFDLHCFFVPHIITSFKTAMDTVKKKAEQSVYAVVNYNIKLR